jgi:hypothetical protein
MHRRIFARLVAVAPFLTLAGMASTARASDPYVVGLEHLSYWVSSYPGTRADFRDQFEMRRIPSAHRTRMPMLGSAWDNVIVPTAGTDPRSLPSFHEASFEMPHCHLHETIGASRARMGECVAMHPKENAAWAHYGEIWVRCTDGWLYYASVNTDGFTEGVASRCGLAKERIVEIRVF